MKTVPALNRLLDLEEIAAVFTYTSDLKLDAAAVPPNYSEQLIEQLVLRIDQVLSLVRKAHVSFKESTFTFEGHTLWVKSYGQDSFLALFIAAEADLSLLRQPINLAVVNLDSASQRRVESDTSVGNTDLLNAAHRAEMELLQAEREVLEYGLRDQEVKLPFSSKSDMVHVVDFASRYIANVEHKKMFLDECAELIERLEVDLPPVEQAEAGE